MLGTFTGISGACRVYNQTDSRNMQRALKAGRILGADHDQQGKWVSDPAGIRGSIGPEYVKYKLPTGKLVKFDYAPRGSVDIQLTLTPKRNWFYARSLHGTVVLQIWPGYDDKVHPGADPEITLRTQRILEGIKTLVYNHGLRADVLPGTKQGTMYPTGWPEKAKKFCGLTD